MEVKLQTNITNKERERERERTVIELHARHRIELHSNHDAFPLFLSHLDNVFFKVSIFGIVCTLSSHKREGVRQSMFNQLTANSLGFNFEKATKKGCERERERERESPTNKKVKKI